MAGEAASGPLGRFDRTNRRLLETLERADGSCSPEGMASLLKRNYQRLLAMLQSYKPPSKESLQALESGKVKHGGKTYPVDKNQQDFVKKISRLLNLDEVQSLLLFRNYLRDEVKGQTFDYSSTALQEIADYYNDERLCLLRCVSSLLRNGHDEDHLYFVEASEIVERLLHDGLVDKVLQQYKSLAKATIPKHLTERQDQERWANQNVEEQLACLEIIFLVYYAQTPISASMIKHLCKLFNKQAFGTKQPNYTLLNEVGRGTVVRMSYICVLILVESFNLESLLEEADQESLAAHPIAANKSAILELDEEFQGWGTIVPQGPVLLAWASLVCRVSQFSDMVDNVPYQQHGVKALRLSAFQFLKNMVQNGFDPEEPNLTGYKSVLKGLVTAIFTAFDISLFPNYELIVEFYCELFQTEPGLCRQYWEHDHQHAPRRALMTIAISCWPIQFNQLLKLFSALAGDHDCAHRVFWELCHMTNFSTFAAMVPPSFCRDPNDDGGMRLATTNWRSAEEAFATMLEAAHLEVYLQRDLPLNVGQLCSSVGGDESGERNARVMDSSVGQRLTANAYASSSVPMFIIPAGTRGRIFKVDNSLLIQWEHKYSIWEYLLKVLDFFLKRLLGGSKVSEQQISSVYHILKLINQLLSFDKNFTTIIQSHLLEIFPNNLTVRNVPISDYANTSEILPRLFLILQHASFLINPPAELLTACLRCINGFAHTHPMQVWVYMRRVGLLDEIASERTTKAFSGCIRHLLHTMECPVGRYPVTLSFLDLLSTLLSFAQRWQLRSSSSSLSSSSTTMISAADFHPCLSYVMTDLFTAFDTWRYTHIYERWQIGIKILKIFQDILRDVSIVPSPTSINVSSQQQKRTRFSSSQLNVINSGDVIVSLKRSLLNSILYDSSFHKVLLNIVGIGTKFLERLIARRKVKEGKTLEKLLVKAFNVLELVLLNRENEVEEQLSRRDNTDSASTPFSAQSSLEYSLLSRTAVLAANENDSTLVSQISATEPDTQTNGFGLPTRPSGGGRLKEEAHLIRIIASYIHYPYNHNLPLLATRLLTLLCRITLHSHPRPPSLVGYLGSHALFLRTAFLSRLKDPLESEELRIAILRLVTTALDCQPGLALLFINITSRKKKNSVTENNQSSIIYEIGSNSCLSTVLSLIANRDQTIHTETRLFCEAMDLLHSLWQVAPDHHTIIKALRDTEGFWKQLINALQIVSLEVQSFDQNENEKGKDKESNIKEKAKAQENGGVAMIEKESKREQTNLQRTYMTIIGSSVFSILALEMYYVPINGTLDPSLVQELKQLNTSPKLQLDCWLRSIPTMNAYTPSLYTRLRKQELKLLHSITMVMSSTHYQHLNPQHRLHQEQEQMSPTALAGYQQQGRKRKVWQQQSGSTATITTTNNVGNENRLLLLKEGRKEPGPNYYYDVELMAKKLFHLVHQTEVGEEDTIEEEDEATMEFDEEARMTIMGMTEERLSSTLRKFLLMTRRVNLSLSLVDAQLQYLVAWKSFLEVSVLRQPALSVFMTASASKGKEESSVVLSLILGLTQVLANEEREDKILNLKMEEIASLLLILLRKHFQFAQALGAENAKGNGGWTFPTKRFVDTLRTAMQLRSQATISLWISLLSCLLVTAKHTPLSEWPEVAQTLIILLPQLGRCLERPLLRNLVLSLFAILFKYSNGTTYDNIETTSNALHSNFQSNAIFGYLLDLLQQSFSASSFTSSVSTPSSTSAASSTLLPPSTFKPTPRLIPLRPPSFDMSGPPTATFMPPTSSLPYASTTSTTSDVSSPPSLKKEAAVEGPLSHNDDLETAEMLLHLFLSFASNSLMAESLALEGVMYLLCNDNYPFFQMIDNAYNKDGERNRWHSVWCLVLAFVTMMLRTLGESEAFVKQVTEFFNVHQHRLAQTLRVISLLPSSSPTSTSTGLSPFSSLTSTTSSTLFPSSSSSHRNVAPHITLAALEEAERTTALLYELGRRPKYWKFYSARSYHHFRMAMLTLLQNSVVLLLPPTQLVRCASPISLNERKLMTTLALPSSSSAFSLSSLSSKQRNEEQNNKKDKGKDKEKEKEKEKETDDSDSEKENKQKLNKEKRKHRKGSFLFSSKDYNAKQEVDDAEPLLRKPFFFLVEQQTYHILRNALSFVRIISPDVPLTRSAEQKKRSAITDFDLDTFIPLFTPSAHLEFTSSSPSLPTSLAVSGASKWMRGMDVEHPIRGGGGRRRGPRMEEEGDYTTMAEENEGEEGRSTSPSIGALIKSMSSCLVALKNLYYPDGMYSSVLASLHPSSSSSKDQQESETNNNIISSSSLLATELEDRLTQSKLLFYCMEVALYLIFTHIKLYLLKTKPFSPVAREERRAAQQQQNGGRRMEQQQPSGEYAHQMEMVWHRVRDEVSMELDTCLVRAVRDLSQIASWKEKKSEAEQTMIQEKVEFFKNAKHFLKELVRDV